MDLFLRVEYYYRLSMIGILYYIIMPIYVVTGTFHVQACAVILLVN